MKKFFTSILIVILLIIGILACATFSYSKSSEFKNDKFPANTKINGIDCSNLTYKQAASKLTEQWNKKQIIVTGSLENTVATFTDFDCTYDIDKKLQESKQENIIIAAANHFVNTPLIIHFPMKIDKYNPEFKQRVVNSSFLNKKNATASNDAYVDLSQPDFPIVSEVYGNKLDTDKFFKDLLHHIQKGEFKFVFDEKDYYAIPEVTTEDESLKEYQEYCKKYLKQKITYSLGTETFTISAEQLNNLMKNDRSGKADDEAVRNYVYELACKYDNIGSVRNFTTPAGKQVTSQGGIYGWQIDQEKETLQLIADINSHKTVTREPVFSVKGYGEYSKGIGNTYIDVDVSNQQVNFYKDGILTFSSNCVTGCKVTGTTTDIGTFYVINKVQDVVLKGNNADGSDYESPVKYWLGINWSGEGFHDADWRSSFGGDIWIKNGSHGCINMPPNRMPELYNKAEVGTPVVVHY